MTLEYLDYTIVFLSLGSSIAIGVYYGFFNKSKTSEDYMFGNRQMKVLPIAISLVASQINPLTIIGFPSEIFVFGITFGFHFIGMIFVVLILIYLIIPIFYENNITNCYDYIEKRFDRRTMIFLKTLFFILGYLYIPVYSYISSQALSFVTTGINVHLINTIVCSICVMYTMLGGLKAVVWTDVLQNFVMFFALLFITYIGVTEVGSFKETFSRASDIGIFEVNTNLDITSKNTIWNCFLSGVLLFTCLIGFNQSCVQRIVSLPTIKDSRKAIILFFIGFIITVSIVCILAVVMAAFFNDCDPLKSGEINQSDNILSYFVQKLSINTRGIQGMYMACVVCASLSTISANINSLSCTLYKDCIKPFIPNSKNNNLIPKIIALLSGVFLICSGFVVEILNSTAIQIITTSLNLVFSTYASTFMLGFLAPRIHSRAMFLSNIVGFIVILGVIVKGQFFSGRVQYEPIEKTFSTDC
uniref:Uncharacterized protein n=1 Tax=Megaselia scalaris TaxID=36166 RepID=T1GN66_MEGSC